MRRYLAQREGPGSVRREFGRGRDGARVLVLPLTPRLIAVCVLCAVALLAVRPVSAHAGWPLAAAARVTVPFGAVYGEDGGSSRHRGVDLEADSGADVRAPFAGTVTFVGRVPAVGGGRVLAVTIDTAAGRVTLLPLGHAEVARGASVAEGGDIGTVATDGDGSSAATHLHVGLRKGDLYVDPLGVMAPPLPADGGEGSGVTVGSAVTEGGGATVGSGVTAGAEAHAGAAGLPAGVSLAPSGVTAPVAAHAAGALGGMGSGVSLAVPAGSRVAQRTPSGVALTESAAHTAPTAHTTGQTVAHEGAVTRPTTNAADEARTRALDSVSAGLGALATRARAAAASGARMALYAALGVLGGIATLWPLWRGARKGIGKVRVSPLEDDVVAAPTR